VKKVPSLGISGVGTLGRVVVKGTLGGIKTNYEGGRREEHGGTEGRRKVQVNSGVREGGGAGGGGRGG